MVFFVFLLLVGCKYVPEYYNPACAVCGFAAGVGYLGFCDVLIEHIYNKLSRKDEKNRQTKTQ